MYPNRNYKFVSLENSEVMIGRVRAWLDIVDSKEEVDLAKLREEKVSEEHMRIFQRDADRTFVPKDDPQVDKRTKVRQDAHVENLRQIVGEVKDYHQGLGYVAAFLSLFLGSEDVVKLALILHRSPKYSAGYFMGAPQAFVADAKVLYKILQKKNPGLHQHLISKGVLPEMFASKWFVGLCLHVLPFECLLEFYENFLTHGAEYIFKFAIQYMSEFESVLMEAKSTSSIMTILRAEDEKADWKLPHELYEKQMEKNIFGRIVTEALSVDLDCDLEELRSSERKAVAAAVEAARKRDQELKDLYSDDEIVFSDEDNDDN